MITWYILVEKAENAGFRIIKELDYLGAPQKIAKTVNGVSKSLKDRKQGEFTAGIGSRAPF